MTESHRIPSPRWLFGPSSESHDAFRHEPHGFSGPGVGRWVCNDWGQRLPGTEDIQIAEDQ